MGERLRVRTRCRPTSTTLPCQWSLAGSAREWLTSRTSATSTSSSVPAAWRQLPSGMRPQARSTFAVRATVCWSARPRLSESRAPARPARGSSIWRRVPSRRPFRPCQECVGSPAAIAATRFWWERNQVESDDRWNNAFVFSHSSQFNNLHNTLARCPHCRKVSSVGPTYTRKRAIMYGAAGLVLLILQIIGVCMTFDYAKVTAILHTLVLSD